MRPEAGPNAALLTFWSNLIRMHGTKWMIEHAVAMD
jgi:hypothetical protein